MSAIESKKIIQPGSASIYGEYFSLHDKYAKIYGEENTVLLLEVGSFFEIYSLYDTMTKTYNTKIESACEMCNLNIAEKKAEYKKKQVCMAGFRNYMSEKYIKILTENGKTVIVYVQEKDGKNIKRVFEGIYSSGTFLPYNSEVSPEISNNVMCIWFENCKNNAFICGLAVINIMTGTSFIYEYPFEMGSSSTTTETSPGFHFCMDELDRYVSVYKPSETIIISHFDTALLNSIIQICGLQYSFTHLIPIKKENIQITNCEKQTYIDYILSHKFGADVFSICAEFHDNIIATQSFCYLLHFIQEHNPKLIEKIQFPFFVNVSKRMLLANHTLKQLNVIDDQINDYSVKNKKSVLSFLNKCCSAIGKREFQNQLLNPVFEEDWIEKQYTLVEKCISLKEIIPQIRSFLKEIKDIEKIRRNIIAKRIYPSSIYHLFFSLKNIKKAAEMIPDDLFILENSGRGVSETHEIAEGTITYCILLCDAFLSNIERNFIIDNCKGINSISLFEENIVQSGINKNLDILFVKYNTSIETLLIIKDYLNSLFSSTSASMDPSTNIKMENNTHRPGNRIKITFESNRDDFVKIHETEKYGITLQITKKRATALKAIFTKYKDGKLIIKPNSGAGIETHVFFKDFKFTAATGSNDEIECPILIKIRKEILSTAAEINNEIAKSFSEYIDFLNNGFLTKEETSAGRGVHALLTLSKFVETIDVAFCKAHNAIELNYCRPSICSSSKSSFINAKEMRHCLIEQLQDNEIYVPNDVEINKNGILLYGINMAGKTSLIRAVGICIILAQSGNFVPCSSFVFSPYTAIFTRILNNDNLFKGLSTFAIEMTELRVILNNSNSNSLILGDEVCSGTETESALSIFVTALETLEKNKSSFIFATHFHDILKYDEIKKMVTDNTIMLRHLSVFYDREKQKMIYDRKLKEGSGSSIYGLEVLHSLFLTDDFIRRAFEMRNKYFPESSGALSLKTSKYNSKKIKGKCEICKEKMGEDVHHLKEQHTANENGFIETFHKNHKANLMTLCKKCHAKEHSI